MEILVISLFVLLSFPYYLEGISVVDSMVKRRDPLWFSARSNCLLLSGMYERHMFNRIVCDMNRVEIFRLHEDVLERDFRIYYVPFLSMFLGENVVL